MGDIGIGIVDGLVLADHAAQFRTEGAGARFLPGIGKLFVGQDGKGGCRREKECKKKPGLHVSDLRRCSSGLRVFSQSSASMGPMNL